MSTKRGWFFVKMAVMGILFFVVVGLVTQMLWNWLVPALFHGPMISFLQAMGLLLLTKILFSGFGGRGRWGSKGYQMRQQWKERYAKLSPEEKERYRQKFKEKWCAWEETPTTQTDAQQNFTEPKV